MKIHARANMLLTFTAAIWGFAFVAQRAGMEHVGPFFFNAVRFALGALVLIPLIALRERRKGGGDAEEAETIPFRNGFLAGLVVFAAASLQQTGLVFTTAGNAGFVTGLYVVLVPVIGLLRKQKCPAGTWVGAMIAVAGMALLSSSGTSRMAWGDLIVFAGSIFWAVHIQLIASIVRRTGALRFAAVQFAVCSILSLAAALIFERISGSGLQDAAIPILYGGLVSVGIAYTLQVVAQRDTHPSHAAIIMSLEAVFALVGGCLVLGESISMSGLLGASMMLMAMILSGIWQSRTGGPGKR